MYGFIRLKFALSKCQNKTFQKWHWISNSRWVRIELNCGVWKMHVPQSSWILRSQSSVNQSVQYLFVQISSEKSSMQTPRCFLAQIFLEKDLRCRNIITQSWGPPLWVPCHHKLGSQGMGPLLFLEHPPPPDSELLLPAFHLQPLLYSGFSC